MTRRRAIFAVLGAGVAVLAMIGPALGEGVVAYRVVDGFSIPEPLTAAPGDPERGRAVAINRRQGNCLSCHVMPIAEQPFHGEVGPSLYGVANRYDAAELRLRVVDAKVVNPDSFMPAFYRTEGLHDVSEAFRDKPILDAQQVEDVVAYLMTLTEEQ